jgi:hypothetical protein
MVTARVAAARGQHPLILSVDLTQKALVFDVARGISRKLF